ncbi:MAG TPA: M67 family metallopeptidase [Anaerolineae bacterium]|nr:M67 family metallopeptidase [Anaerolineae bacterium]
MLIMSQAQYEEMLAHLRGDLTQERCGLLAGETGRVLRVLPVPNSLRSPWAYRMDGPEFIEAMRACNFEPLAIYHSHPVGPPTPSATDVAEATYPDSIYVIVSFGEEPPGARAFRIAGGQVSEVELRVE